MTHLTLKKDWKKVFLDSLTKSPNVSKAARAAGYTRQRMYQLRDEDPGFAAEWDSALDEAIDDAEGETYRRAVKGTLKPVFQKGEEVGKIREYSDTLLMFWLKAHRPEKYRETTKTELEHSGAIEQKHSGSIEMREVDYRANLGSAEIEA